MRHHVSLLGRLVRLAASIVIASGVGSAQCLDWQPGFGSPGPSADVTALCVFDDGSGAALYVAGRFETAGDLLVNHVARWDGSAWNALGAGTDGAVDTLAVFDDGTGPALYAGGQFTSPGRNVARWDGASWSALGSGVSDSTHERVRTLAVFDDGTGPALVAGGAFELAGGVAANNLAQWDGTSWSPLGTGITAGLVPVHTLAVFDDGGGDDLYIGGVFTHAGGVAARNAARFDGTSFSALGDGLDDRVASLCAFGSGATRGLYAGGVFRFSGSLAVNRFARWNGTAWEALGAGTDATVEGLSVSSFAGEERLVLTGAFNMAGSIPARAIASWNGSYAAVGELIDAAAPFAWAFASATFDDGGGGAPRLFVGGSFDGSAYARPSFLAAWDDTIWHDVFGAGLGANAIVEAIDTLQLDEGSVLVVGGQFTQLGAERIDRVASWDGVAWSPLGSGADGTVEDLETFPFGDGACAELVAGGRFLTIGGVVSPCIARWDGNAWSSLGGGVSGAAQRVDAMRVFDAGAGDGPELYVGGQFLMAGPIAASCIARWNGVVWRNAGSVGGFGLPELGVRALEVFDGGSGPRLYVGGVFPDVGSAGQPLTVASLAAWDGTHYTALGAGLEGESPFVRVEVNALAVYDDGTGPALYVGGKFRGPLGSASPALARWNGQAWSAVPTGFSVSDDVSSLCVFDDGGGPALYVAVRAAPAPRLHKWDGVACSAIDPALTSPGINGWPSRGIEAMHVDASAPDGVARLYLGGDLDRIGDIPSTNIAALRSCVPAAGAAFCFGDGSLATPCPCAPPDFVPNPPAAIGHGCANSFHLDGAQLFASGSTANDDVALASRAQTPSGFAFFIVGTADIVAGFATADGVRCAGGAITRFGSQFAVCGSVRYPNPAAGWTLPLSTVSGTTPGSGLTKYYQVFYRNAAAGFCSAGTANFTSGYQVVW